jgi:hypothetical protein
MTQAQTERVTRPSISLGHGESVARTATPGLVPTTTQTLLEGPIATTRLLVFLWHDGGRGVGDRCMGVAWADHRPQRPRGSAPSGAHDWLNLT